MITYNLSELEGPLYKNLYELIKQDIKTGKLKSHEKIPSKRNFAKNLGISTISVENAYEQLISEGYVYAIPKKGYFVSDMSKLIKVQNVSHAVTKIDIPKEEDDYKFNFSSNQVETSSFPFSVWAKVIREAISNQEENLLKVSPCGGVKELRSAISEHLCSFRGMNVNADQVIVGAGTEYLYGLLVKLLGNDKTYCIETPGYNKLVKIYESNGVECKFASMDNSGIIVDELTNLKADIAHVSPTHHFPTGITMPVSRRYELISWANENANRYIIEDDYDSEFRLNGNPIPPLQSLDVSGKIIYMNTFSKSLTSTIRISYMVLPEKLANKFYETLGFYSCTVSTFEQYALAAFINEGYFERHINRMRLYYGRKRTRVIQLIKKVFTDEECTIIENDSGLHFVLQFNTKCSDKSVKEKLIKHKIKISSVTDFNLVKSKKDKHQFILNYSNINLDKLTDALKLIRKELFLS